MKKSFVLHPYLFALFPILFVYSKIHIEIFFSEVIILSVALLILIFLLEWSFSLLPLNKKEIALIISFFLIIFFSFGALRDGLKHVVVLGFRLGRDRYTVTFLLLIFTLGTYLVIRTKSNLKNITSAFNITSIILILIQALNISIIKFHDFNNSTNSFGINVDSVKINKRINKAELPNVYYIIMDGYASSSTLREIYGYDNSDFENFLSSKGFYIASESRSNYAETRLSLASSLNMEHLNKYGKLVDVPLLHRLIKENKVSKIFKSYGYEIINVSSANIGKVKKMETADVNLQSPYYISIRFQGTLLHMTILSAFYKYIDFGFFYRNEILNIFQNIGKINQKINKPYFVFAHILSPHPPYVFGPNGETVKGILKYFNGNLAYQKKWYMGQLKFVNNKLKKVVNDILSSSKGKTIIILQSDHGSALYTKDRLKARMRIFNAFYLPPGDGQDIIYDSITPVNTFRRIFNHYFNMNFEMLEAKSYFTDYSLPYNFLDVTDSILVSESKDVNYR